MKDARIASHNDLIVMEGLYAINIRNGYRNGSIKIHSDDISASWDVGFKMSVADNVTWGQDYYQLPDGSPGPKRFLANCKLFRMWNPGSTKENLFVELDAVANELKLQIEDEKGNVRKIYYFAKGITDRLVGDNYFFFRYRENSVIGASDGGLSVTLNGGALFHKTDLLTRSTDSGLKRPHTLGLHSVWESGPDGDAQPNDFMFSEFILKMDTTEEIPIEPPIQPPNPEPPIIAPPDILPPDVVTYPRHWEVVAKATPYTLKGVMRLKTNDGWYVRFQGSSIINAKIDPDHKWILERLDI